jgi:hypothetical protein
VLVLQRECPHCAGTGQDGHGYGHPCPSCADGLVSETVESSGVARCATEEVVVAYVNGMPVVHTTYEAVEGLPSESLFCPTTGQTYLTTDRSYWSYACPFCKERVSHEPVGFVVSSIVAQAVPDRRDVFVPARPVRDEKGRIVACRALGRVAW